MHTVGLTDLPGTIRVQLSEESTEQLWRRVDDAGGITTVSERHNYPRTQLYNWKHKSDFLPIPFVRMFLDEPEVTAVKGGGRSRPWRDPVFPIEADDELLTRIHASIHVNRDGVPTYQASDVGLVQRFLTLLEQYGDVPVALYHRASYELRYPKYLHIIFQLMDYDPDFAAEVDEHGSIEDGYVTAGETRVPINEFDGTLYHRGKKLQLALARGDTDAITRLMAAEAEKVQQLVRE